MAHGAKHAMKSFVKSLPLGKRVIGLISGGQAPAGVAPGVAEVPAPGFAESNKAELGRLRPGDTVAFAYSAGGLLIGDRYEAVQGKGYLHGEIALVRDGDNDVIRAAGIPRTDWDTIGEAIAAISDLEVIFDRLAEEDRAADQTDNDDPPDLLADLWTAHDPDRASAAWRADFRAFAKNDPLVGFLDAVVRYRAAPSVAGRDAVNRTYLNRAASTRVQVEPMTLAMFAALPARTAAATDLDAVTQGACNQYPRYDEFKSSLAARQGTATVDAASDDSADAYDADDEWDVENEQAIVVELDDDSGGAVEPEPAGGDRRPATVGAPGPRARAPLTPEQRRNLAEARGRYGPAGGGQQT